MDRVGVLALQGGFANHAAMLRELGVEVVELRSGRDLVELDGLVLPGGESTTMMLGIEREGLARPLRELIEGGLPVLATCAGLILLDDAHLGLLDVSCARNSYGSQVHSFEAPVSLGDGTTFPGVFIRAPRITRVGPDVAVSVRLGEEPVGVTAGAITACTFHPELTEDKEIHARFVAGKAA